MGMLQILYFTVCTADEPLVSRYRELRLVPHVGTHIRITEAFTLIVCRNANEYRRREIIGSIVL